MQEIQVDYIETELKKFNVTDEALAKIHKEFMPLKIEGIEDKEGYKKVKESRLLVRRHRIDVENKRKELKADSLKFGRMVDEEAKRIISSLSTVEDHLLYHESKFDEEIERIKQEKLELEKSKYQERVHQLTSIGFVFNGISFNTQYTDILENKIKITEQEVKLFSEEQFSTFVSETSLYFHIEQKRISDEKIKQEEIIKQEEEKRIAEFEELRVLREEKEKQKEHEKVLPVFISDFTDIEPRECLPAESDEPTRRITLDFDEENKLTGQEALNDLTNKLMENRINTEIENKILIDFIDAVTSGLPFSPINESAKRQQIILTEDYFEFILSKINNREFQGKIIKKIDEIVFMYFQEFSKTKGEVK